MTENSVAHVRRLWRHRGGGLSGPRRGPARQLELDEILRVGIALADERGLDAVSTRAVAARLDVSAMALYPYVGTKENLLALMQDQACLMPPWDDPGPGLAGALRAWAGRLFGVYVTHPWLARRPWSQSSQGPNEQDWLERLLHVLDRWQVAPAARAPAVTMLYATVRATAETAAEYRAMDGAAWRAQVAATAAVIPDFAARYPLSAALPPVAADWRDAPRAGLDAAVGLIAAGLGAAP
jgi:AcrR family transcriptional regulator